MNCWICFIFQPITFSFNKVLMTFSPCGIYQQKKWRLLLTSLIPSISGAIKFTYELSSSKAVFLDTEVFEGPRFSTLNIPDIRTHFKLTKTFQYTHFSTFHPLNTKKDFIKVEALRLLRTNFVKEDFENFKRDLKQRLSGVRFENRKEALRSKPKERMRFYRLSQLTIWLYQILERFSWNTGTLSRTNQVSHKSSNMNRLYPTGRKNRWRTSLSTAMLGDQTNKSYMRKVITFFSSDKDFYCFPPLAASSCEHTLL